MKRKVVFILILLFSIVLIACGNENSTETKDWESTQYDVVDNFDGVTMNIKENTVSSMGLTLVFKNNSDKQGIYSNDFLLESKIKGDWYQLPTILDEYGFNDIGYELPPSENKEFSIEWDWLYGSLDPGEYRIIKKILDFRDTGDYDEYYLTAQFTIE